MLSLSALDLSSYLGLTAATLLPVDFFDGEKVYVEILALILLGVIWWRIRHRWVRHVLTVQSRATSASER